MTISCRRPTLYTENIRDILVVGIRDKDLSKRLQLIKDLRLDVAVQIVRQAEDVIHQVSQQGDPPAG